MNKEEIKLNKFLNLISNFYDSNYFEEKCGHFKSHDKYYIISCIFLLIILIFLCHYRTKISRQFNFDFDSEK